MALSVSRRVGLCLTTHVVQLPGGTLGRGRETYSLARVAFGCSLPRVVLINLEARGSRRRRKIEEKAANCEDEPVERGKKLEERDTPLKKRRISKKHIPWERGR